MSLVELARYPDAALAHILRGRLEAAGIHTVCFDTGMNAAEGVPMLIGVRLMVLPEDVAEARAVLADYEAEAQEVFGDDPFAGEVFDDRWDTDEPFDLERKRSRLFGWGGILLGATFIVPLVAALLD